MTNLFQSIYPVIISCGYFQQLYSVNDKPFQWLYPAIISSKL